MTQILRAGITLALKLIPRKYDTPSNTKYEMPCDEDYDSEQYDIDIECSTDMSESISIDEPYFMPPSTQLYATVACMILSRRLDFFHPPIVKLIR